MNFRELLADDDAVSPVIGVILMVAITVILAAVIGTFVLGLGDQVSQSQPSANIGFSYTEHLSGNYTVTVTHKGGDKLNGNNLNLSVASTTEEMSNLATTTKFHVNGTNTWSGDSITAGTELSVHTNTPPIGNGDTVRIIWSADNGDTAIIAESTVQ